MDKTAMRFALDAYTRGWHIFPCDPNDKQPALLYPGTDKPWRLKWGDAATNDINQIIQWWTTNPQYNIGISAKKSGLLIVDCDLPKEFGVDDSGWDQFQRLCEQRGVDWGDAIDTYMVETPSKGVHLYYWWPEGVLASQASLDTLLDVRTNGGEWGGYVLGAGSQVSGWYHCFNPAPVKPAPSWLVDEVRYEAPQKSGAPFRRPGPINKVGLLRSVRNAPQGNRNQVLYWAAVAARQESPDLDAEDLVHLFMEDAREAGLTSQEIRGTVTSAYRKVRRDAQRLGV
jgi:hypothetical protein